MQKRVFILTSVICFCVFSAFSQNAVDKVNNAIYEADKVSGTFGKMKGLLPKKKKKDTVAVVVPITPVKDSSVTVAVNTGFTLSIVTVSGIDYARLKKLHENIKACMGVDSTAVKYSSAASTILVKHKGSTEELLQLMQETSADIFTEKNIEGLENGKIFLKL